MLCSIVCQAQFANGITITAPPDPFKENPMDELEELCPTWVAVIPYGLIARNQHRVKYGGSSYQWWGETTEGIKETIRLAREKSWHVMLKPHIWLVGGWVGDLQLTSAEEIKSFEESYAQYILHFAGIAEDMGIEMLCLGTELKRPIADHPEIFTRIIKKIRQVFHGKLIYAANWDNYQNIPFWDQLDAIGINSYFPLSETKTPTKEELILAWIPVLSSIELFGKKHDKEIWFTEYGYLSVDGTTGKTWELEDNIGALSINEEAQANALAAFYTIWKNVVRVKGGFLWKWFPEGKGHEGYPDKDYTPQGKKAENTIKYFFCD